ncbi:signal peptidase I [Niameybacter massiliensis]|uniref:Signal peptidase I n=1 Tax=Holtiella tumoricola TaxID=3018743 RepID=A0AA42DPN9_9FIRM|nr:signal peptidase I [Holtiella tumoricola]MDA3732546.1 signal peptidase I [Holtiella tumoricola]
MKDPRGKKKDQLLGFFKDLIIAIIVVLVVNAFLVQNLKVQGTSMAPLLDNNNMVIINKLAYKMSMPKKGDIIGFYTNNVKTPVVKRIVGLSGDIIDYKDGQLYINGTPINNSDEDAMMHRGDIKYPFTVAEGTYFVLGDNYNSSIDSRFNYIGCVPKKNIVGRISLRIWPFWKNPFLK